MKEPIPNPNVRLITESWHNPKVGWKFSLFCYLPHYRSNLGDYIDGGFSKDGISIISLGLDYMGRPCEPDGVVIPFSLLAPYLKTTAPFMKSANLQAK